MAWFQAHMLTRLGALELQERPDGDFDIRKIGEETPYAVVPQAFFKAEFCSDPECKFNVPVNWVPVDTSDW